MPNEITLSPEYLNHFQCIGTACEDTCCAGWRVTIDKASYKKYRNLRNSPIKSSLDRHVKRARNNNSDSDYALIKLDNKGLCPLLNTEKLCGIQAELGESYLSNTCATYPRIIKNVNGVVETSLSLSCPEAARLALLNPAGIAFDQKEQEAQRYSFAQKLSTRDKNNKAIQIHFWDLRVFVIGLLQNRTYTLEERLVILGLFMQKLQASHETDPQSGVLQLISSYQTIIADGNFSEVLNGIPASSKVQMVLLKFLTDSKVAAGINNARYLACFKEMLAGLEMIAASTAEQENERYENVYFNYYQPFMSEHEYILENYLVNDVFKNLFPLSGDGHVFDEYMMFIIRYAIIKLHLIGMSGYYREKFNQQHIVKLIQSFSRVYEHNPTYFKEIRELLIKNNYNTMAYMAILIKN